FDAKAMIKVVETQLPSVPGSNIRRFAIDDLPASSQNQRVPNAAIDVKADYRLHPVTVPDCKGGQVTVNVFGVPDGSTTGPIATGGFPGGIATQSNTGFLKLVPHQQGNDFS